MKIEELITWLERANKHNQNRELNVVIPIYSPGGIGGTPYVSIKQVHSGFDWDAGKVFLTPENPVTELTPEQVKEIHESVSKGQSWHAYEKWKKNKEEKQALKARLAALEAVCGEIVKGAPQSENELEQMYEFYVNGGLQKEVGHASYGEEVQKFIIAQKLKAVLEEA